MQCTFPSLSSQLTPRCLRDGQAPQVLWEGKRDHSWPEVCVDFRKTRKKRDGNSLWRTAINIDSPGLRPRCQKKKKRNIDSARNNVDAHFFPQVWGTLSCSCFKYTFCPLFFLFFWNSICEYWLVFVVAFHHSCRLSSLVPFFPHFSRLTGWKLYPSSHWFFPFVAESTFETLCGILQFSYYIFWTLSLLGFWRVTIWWLLLPCQPSYFVHASCS